MIINKISCLKQLVCLNCCSYQSLQTNPTRSCVDSGDNDSGTPFGTYKALIDPVAQGETKSLCTRPFDAGLRCRNTWKP